MTHRPVLRLFCLPIAALLAGAVLAGTAPAQAAPAPAAPAAAAPAAATVDPGPVCATQPAPSVVRLTNADDNREICVVRGQTIEVTLTVDTKTYPDPAMWWSAVTSSSKILTAMPVPRVPPAGTTIGVFRAEDLGTSTLWSTQTPCVPRPGWLCPAWLNYWDVRVHVVA